ncbi:hypothetical protein HYY75_03530 [bacterium]|nr:hypothetical protein [bacterium]
MNSPKFPKKPPRNSAFTAIELVISIGVAIVAFSLIYTFLSRTRFHFMHGSVNLANLQEARMAINYLRRDFAAAVPFIAKSANYGTLERVRRFVFSTGVWKPLEAEGELIQVEPTKLSFHRFIFEPSEKQSETRFPKVELVKYDFDSSKGELHRSVNSGKPQVFRGFENVEFKIYVHYEIRNVPVLWVKLVLNEGKDIPYGGQKGMGKPLEVTTSITSQFINSTLNNLYWNYETGHQK